MTKGRVKFAGVHVKGRNHPKLEGHRLLTIRSNRYLLLIARLKRRRVSSQVILRTFPGKSTTAELTTRLSWIRVAMSR